MFNRYELKLILDNNIDINFEYFSKADLITMIKILRDEIRKLKMIR